MKVGIIGYGVVGKATEVSFISKETLFVHDLSIKNSSIKKLYKCELIFICIPTNNKKDIRKLKKICIKIGEKSPNVEIVIRSTVTPGFFKSLIKKVKCVVTYAPEFLRERYSIEDSINCSSIFYATTSKKSKLNDLKKIKYKLKRINFEQLELLKMMRNNYHAMKIVFANHYYDICKKYKVDYSSLLNFFYELKKNQSYMEVNEDLRGYGGKCLPKDIDFMIEEFGKNVALLRAIKKDNKKWKITVRTDK